MSGLGLLAFTSQSNYADIIKRITRVGFTNKQMQMYFEQMKSYGAQIFCIL